ncbi:putative lipid II flippase FtsW [Robiginitomaculum antarcticum]|uniref:putative lipid II flippase FtsW n=1 Tax=Robiginitomaculum antarcticum TaxID=437507 RepID=UPI000377B6DD|nr:putative lipid II flippase FtsW [Robiginitomaculum antarcticum]
MILTAQRSNRSFLLEWWRSVDRVLIGIFATLILAGLILSLAASPAAAAKLGGTDPFYFFTRHLFFVFVGISGAMILSMFSPMNARRLAVLALLGAIIVMFALNFIGHEVKGATRWVKIGSFSLQPSEFAKPGFIVFAAWMFAQRKKDITFPGIAIVFGVYILLVLMLLRQPDFGQSFLLTLCFGAIFFFAGLSLGWMLFLGCVSMAGAVVAFFALPHVQDRLMRFLNPEGSDTYQTDKALEAISNGGIFGRGPGEGRVKEQLPDAHTDFIFAVAVEEFGFLISLLLIALLAALVIQAFRKALRLNDHFAQLAVAGLATMIGVQTIINLAVNLNMVPPKGMTLPFISYGGSSMLALCFSMGLILAFTRKRAGAYGYGVY